MKKFRTVASVIIMVIAGIVGFFIGAFLNEPMAGTILFSMIAGIACIVYAIDNHEEQGKFQLCAQPRVCSQAGGNPVYLRFSQPDTSESWDDVGNGI